MSVTGGGDGAAGDDARALVAEVGEFRDTIVMAYALNVTIRFVPPWVGPELHHCHIFKHSDGGMVMIANITAPLDARDELSAAAAAPAVGATSAWAWAAAVVGAVVSLIAFRGRRARDPERRKLLVQHDARGWGRFDATSATSPEVASLRRRL